MKVIQLLTFAVTASIFLGCSGGKTAKVYDASTGELVKTTTYSTAKECETAITARREFTDHDRCVRTLAGEEFMRTELAAAGKTMKTAKELVGVAFTSVVAKQQAREDEFYKAKCECLVRYGYLGIRGLALGKRTCAANFKVTCGS